MPEPFDPAALQAAIDEIEGRGVPPALVEQLRELVREKDRLGFAVLGRHVGESIHRGQVVIQGTDGRFYRSRPGGNDLIMGIAVRDLMPGEFAPYDPWTGRLG